MKSCVARIADRSESGWVTRFENRDKHFLSRTRIGCTLQNYELALAKVGRNCTGCLFDIAEVWLMIVVERSWYANDNGIQLRHFGICTGSTKSMRTSIRNFGCRNPNNVGFSGVESRDLFGIDIETGNSEALLAKEKRKGKANVPHAYDSNSGFARRNAGFHFGRYNGRYSHKIAPIAVGRSVDLTD